MAVRLHLSLLLALAGLAGCGSQGGAPEGVLIARGLVQALSPQPADPAAMPALPDFTEAQVRDAPNPLIGVVLEVARASALLGRIAVNGPVQTYASADGISVSLQRGLVIATRGIGDDLLIADISAVPSLPAGGASYQRRWQHFDSMTQIETTQASCALTREGSQNLLIAGRSVATTLMVERCAAPFGQIVNRYWVDPQGRARQSRQWVSDSVGYLQFSLP